MQEFARSLPLCLLENFLLAKVLPILFFIHKNKNNACYLSRSQGEFIILQQENTIDEINVLSSATEYASI